MKYLGVTLTMIKVFDYIEELDAFVVRNEFSVLVQKLGLGEWSNVVWIGRYFARDQDFGEHWFDNWEEREALEEKAEALGIDYEQLLIVVPDRFAESDPICIHCFNKDGDSGEYSYRYLPCPKCGKDIHVGPDGPCNPPELRKRFWTDVLKSLHISLETLFEQARYEASRDDEHTFPGEVNSAPIEQIIEAIKDEYRD